MSSLKVTFCGVEFPNPLILPSGIAQEIPKDHLRYAKAGVGGITAKSLTIEPREGYPVPRIIKYDCGILNAVGFRGPGIEKGKEQLLQLMKLTKVPIIASVFSTRIEEIKVLVSEVASLNPPLIELNISCPHVYNEFGESLAMNEKTAHEAVKVAKKAAGKIPLIAKLSPNVSNIDKVAKACEDAGADAISAINTVGPGMVIDIKSKKPVLGNKRGGVSGPGIKPIAIRCIYDIYQAVDIPIIGMGGVANWEDVVEMMMAGATLVGIGSAAYMKGIKIYEDIKKDLKKYLEVEKIKSINKLIGTAHE